CSASLTLQARLAGLAAICAMALYVETVAFASSNQRRGVLLRAEASALTSEYHPRTAPSYCCFRLVPRRFNDPGGAEQRPPAQLAARNWCCVTAVIETRSSSPPQCSRFREQ